MSRGARITNPGALVCNKCKQPTNGFKASWRICRNCHNARFRELQRGYYKRDPEVNRAIRLKQRYGITPEHWRSMAEAQGWKCAVCGIKAAQDKDLHVDHCHESGAVRQLLCGTCNRGIGSFRDNPELMRVAAQYVEKHKSKCATT